MSFPVFYSLLENKLILQQIKLNNSLYNILPKTLFVGKTIKYLPVCRSTNDIAQELLKTEHPIEGTVIICSQQTAGRGQQGNKWESESHKNLTFSTILFPKIDLPDQFILNVITSNSIAEALSQILPGFKFEIKWPNDIYVLDKKISGILIQNNVRQNLIHSAVVGIGININQLTFNEKKAISLSALTGTEFDLEKVLSKVLECLEVNYLLSRTVPDSLWKKYHQRLLYLGEERRFSSLGSEFSGKIVKVQQDGLLVVSTELGLEKFNLKEIEYL